MADVEILRQCRQHLYYQRCSLKLVQSFYASIKHILVTSSNQTQITSHHPLGDTGDVCLNRVCSGKFASLKSSSEKKPSYISTFFSLYFLPSKYHFSTLLRTGTIWITIYPIPSKKTPTIPPNQKRSTSSQTSYSHVRKTTLALSPPPKRSQTN